jgi:hypothetical protein
MESSEQIRKRIHLQVQEELDRPELHAAKEIPQPESKPQTEVYSDGGWCRQQSPPEIKPIGSPETAIVEKQHGRILSLDCRLCLIESKGKRFCFDPRQVVNKTHSAGGNVSEGTAVLFIASPKPCSAYEGEALEVETGEDQ